MGKFSGVTCPPELRILISAISPLAKLLKQKANIVTTSNMGIICNILFKINRAMSNGKHPFCGYNVYIP